MLRTDILLIDESSMISREFLNFIKQDVALNKVKAVIFVGDLYQLPAVEEVDKDKCYIPLIYRNLVDIKDKDGIDLHHYVLSELIRNPDMEVIDFVTNVRNMIAENKTKNDLIKFLQSEMKKEHKKIRFFNNRKRLAGDFIKDTNVGDVKNLIATFTNQKVENYNVLIRDYLLKKHLMLDQSDEAPILAVEDVFVVKETVENEEGEGEGFQNSEILYLRDYEAMTVNIGDKIIKGFNCTTQCGRNFNYLHKDSRDAYEHQLGLLHAYALASKNHKHWEMYFKLKELFLGVEYQYASTIHKSQGSSYENVWIDCTNISYVDDNFLLRLFYVASTRSSQNVNILI